MQRAFFLLSGKLLKSVHIQSPVEGAVFSITLIQAKRQLVQTSAGFDLTEQLKLTEEYLCVDRPGQNAYKQLYVAKHDKTVVYKEIGFLNHGGGGCWGLPFCRRVDLVYGWYTQ